MPLFRRPSPSTPAPQRGAEIMTPWLVVRRVAWQSLFVVPLYTLAIVLGTALSGGLAEALYLARGRPNHWQTRQTAIRAMTGYHFTAPRLMGADIEIDGLPMGQPTARFLQMAQMRGWKPDGIGRLAHTSPNATTQVVFRTNRHGVVTGVSMIMPGVTIRDAVNIQMRSRFAWGPSDAAIDLLDKDLGVHGLTVWRRANALFLVEIVPAGGELYQVTIEGRHVADPLFAERAETFGLSPADPRIARLRDAAAAPAAPPAAAATPPPFINPAPGQVW